MTGVFHEQFSSLNFRFLLRLPCFLKFGMPHTQDALYSVQKADRGNLYIAATVILSPRSAFKSGEYSEMSDMTGLKSFVAELAGHIAAEAVT
jgi:hypothetical protein